MNIIMRVVCSVQSEGEFQDVRIMRTNESRTRLDNACLYIGFICHKHVFAFIEVSPLYTLLSFGQKERELINSINSVMIYVVL